MRRTVSPCTPGKTQVTAFDLSQLHVGNPCTFVAHGCAIVSLSLCSPVYLPVLPPFSFSLGRRSKLDISGLWLQSASLCVLRLFRLFNSFRVDLASLRPKCIGWLTVATSSAFAIRHSNTDNFHLSCAIKVKYDDISSRNCDERKLCAVLWTFCVFFFF